MAQDKLAMARISGMQYALEIVERDGIEGLKAEIHYRSKYQVPLNIPKKQVDEFTENAKCNLMDTMKRIVSIVLHDEFGFSKVRLERFYARFESQCECVMKDYVTFKDMEEILKNECRIRLLPIRENNKNVK